jgi:hypothetical protein
LSEDWDDTKRCFKYLFSSGYYIAVLPNSSDLENEQFHDKFYFTSMASEKDFDKIFNIMIQDDAT